MTDTKAEKTVKVTKEMKAIAVMKENAHLDMHAVKPLIAAAIGVDLDRAQHYYWTLSRNGKAPGVFIKKPMGRRAAKKDETTPASKPTKTAKAPKTPEEIAEIRKANMAKLQAHNATKKAAAAAVAETEAKVA
jgi:Xaa-Pro aminopeptidase